MRSSGSRPIQCALYYQFVQRALSVSDYGSLESYLYRIRRQARAGDPMSELTYGMVLVGLPQLHKGQGGRSALVRRRPRPVFRSRSSRPASAC